MATPKKPTGKAKETPVMEEKKDDLSFVDELPDALICETAKSSTEEVILFGENPWKLIYRLDNRKTSAMYIKNIGCIVRTGDSMAFVPGAKINEITNEEGVVINREIVKA